MSFAMPSTPPRSAKRKAPQLSITETTPTTPAKGKGPQKYGGALETPRKTPHKSKSPLKQKLAKTPKDTLAPPSLLGLLPTPGFTPHKSPRHRRKRPMMDDLVQLLELLGMLLPNHLVAGSGRKSVLPQKLHAPISLDLRELSKINKNLAFEEDEEDEEEVAAPESPTRRTSRRKQQKTTVSTPGKQLISEEMVEQWHGKLFNNQFSSDDEESEQRLEPLANPFVDSEASPVVAKPKTLASSGVNYSTHNEYINTRTGERKVVELTDAQKKFKPKKLNFSGL